jgi:two-component sensor histidine kinase
LTSIKLKKYLERIVHNISNSYKNITLHVDVQEINLEFDNAVSLGIIVNEIFTNALKHNFDKKDFNVKVALTKKDKTISLVIQDNGSGFKVDQQKKGIGLNLIKQFCKKLPNSKYKFYFENGTKFGMEFQSKEKNIDLKR